VRDTDLLSFLPEVVDLIVSKLIGFEGVVNILNYLGCIIMSMYIKQYKSHIPLYMT